MRKLLAIIPALMLAGCATTSPTLIRTEQIVVMPDSSLFNCPNVRKFPNPETLTDSQVAELLVTLHRNNTNCQRNINAIKMALEEAKKTTEQNNKR